MNEEPEWDEIDTALLLERYHLATLRSPGLCDECDDSHTLRT